MELTGKIISVLEPRKGMSPRTGSEWVCGQYVMETMDQYPRKMFFEVFGADRMQQFNLQMGDVVTVSFDIDAREYNGRWFNSIRAFKVDRSQQPAVGGSQVPPVPPMPTQAPSGLTEGAPFAAASEGEDLPF